MESTLDMDIIAQYFCRVLLIISLFSLSKRAIFISLLYLLLIT